MDLALALDISKVTIGRKGCEDLAPEAFRKIELQDYYCSTQEFCHSGIQILSDKEENLKKSDIPNISMTENSPPKKTFPDEHGELYGHDLYPERRKLKEISLKNTLLMKNGTENFTKLHCEQKVYNCIKKNPLVKLMMGALKSSGCDVDVRRHLSCEECDSSVTGGYDPELNQIVVCQNTAKMEGIVGSVLTHEMIHMFDYCQNNLDFKNIDHLACTEVRAANLTYCSFTSAMIDGDAALWDMKKRHQDCVKRRAMLSVLASRGVTHEEARTAVARVFEKCYSDMEPIGRRIKRGTKDMNKALLEASLFGYEI